MSRGIRPSTTESTFALWAKSLLNAVLFFSIFMVALPFLAHWLFPRSLPLPRWVAVGTGVPLFIAGLVVWAICLDHFSRRGRGTPFPLDAPQRLVVSGPHAIIRNPIIAAEIAVVWGEALFFASWGLLVYAVVISGAGHLAVVAFEEPELRQRFGESYDRYCREVPRWFPRLQRRPRDIPH